MTAERLRHIRTVFESVADLSPDDRLRILDKSRDDDSSLVAEVEQLLAAHLRPDEFLDQPIANHSPSPARETMRHRWKAPRRNPLLSRCTTLPLIHTSTCTLPIPTACRKWIHRGT